MSRRLSRTHEENSACPGGERDGFTMVEMVIGMLLVALLVSVLIESVALSRRLTYSNAQRVTAFGMSKAKLEEVRGMEYEELDPTNFVAETGLGFMHLSGRDRNAISCQRTVTLTPLMNPERTDVAVTVAWVFRGTPFTEQITATVYPK